MHFKAAQSLQLPSSIQHKQAAGVQVLQGQLADSQAEIRFLTAQRESMHNTAGGRWTRRTSSCSAATPSCSRPRHARTHAITTDTAAHLDFPIDKYLQIKRRPSAQNKSCSDFIHAKTLLTTIVLQYNTLMYESIILVWFLLNGIMAPDALVMVEPAVHGAVCGFKRKVADCMRWFACLKHSIVVTHVQLMLHI